LPFLLSPPGSHCAAAFTVCTSWDPVNSISDFLSPLMPHISTSCISLVLWSSHIYISCSCLYTFHFCTFLLSLQFSWAFSERVLTDCVFYTSAVMAAAFGVFPLSNLVGLKYSRQFFCSSG
jgi:hypothetical protein